MRFSERQGFISARTEIQTFGIDESFRVAIWNVVFQVYFENVRMDWTYSTREPFGRLLAGLWTQFHKGPLDELPEAWEMRNKVKEWILKAEWFHVYDLVESFAQLGGDVSPPRIFAAVFNATAQRNMGGYRLVDSRIVQATSAEVVEAIDRGLADARQAATANVQNHLSKALALLADRKSPDYPNSIKESISAVEALARLVTGREKATLGDAVRRFRDSGLDIHPALEGALLKLYGYSSDADGIRHAARDIPSSSHEDALFFLGTCSSFVSYMIAKCAKAEISLVQTA
ncbi:AbiJ-NTD4 domain-containing protein [Frankia sp. EI5c]|uniref:AbiJ-NTD4 domain-containing protein n=1 Tax=Frankia sp. EI5c TaxID=683316 RepID=UPI000A6AE582|nr:hypothetical protein [Frankia sp. EI5c]